MIPNYIQDFPLPEASMSPKLRSLLEPAGNDPLLSTEVSSRYEFDQYGPEYEYVHMLMALTDDPESIFVDDFGETSDGVVSFSTPCVSECGGLPDVSPSISGNDYIVASSGSGSFFTYSLAEKVWMTLGLSPRSVGGDTQKIIFDDLSLPEFGVAEGEITNSYYYESSRNISWKMSNEYLRQYLWMRGKYGTRVFFHEAHIEETPAITALLGAEQLVNFKPDNGWYELTVRRINGRVLIQTWAVVCAAPPEQCITQTADTLVWPGTAGAMSRSRANALVAPSVVYLDDRFLTRYEQNSFYDTVPMFAFDGWACNPSYMGQWAFADCRRVGRNLVKVRLRELYKGIPDRELVWAHSHVVTQDHANQFDLNDEHIVAKVQRFLDTLLNLSDGFVWLAEQLGEDSKSCEDIMGFSRDELRKNGWAAYPKLCRLAQVATANMSEQMFLSRCKEIHELWQKLPNGFVRKIVSHAGHDPKKYSNFGSLKLLQVLTNILERLNGDCEAVTAFDAAAEQADIVGRNPKMAALFLNAELRNADAHGAATTSKTLSELGFDISLVNSGYGGALDFVFDEVIDAFAHITAEIEILKSNSTR